MPQPLGGYLRDASFRKVFSYAWHGGCKWAPFLSLRLLYNLDPVARILYNKTSGTLISTWTWTTNLNSPQEASDLCLLTLPQLLFKS
jgi:hypothetical protein